jgi:hypothetical protein
MTQPFTTLSVHHAFGYTWTNLLLMEQVIFVSDGTTNTIIPNVKVEMGIKKNNLRVRYFFIVEDFPALKPAIIDKTLSEPTQIPTILLPSRRYSGVDIIEATLF